MVVPARMREALGVKEGGVVSMRLDSGRLIVEPVTGDLRERVSEWVRLVKSSNAEAFSEESEDSEDDWRMMSREYAARKAGVR
jgi:antitoxin component of MazEF toxin-antitoxin module